MRISNLRFGHACNSSSLQSIIVCKNRNHGIQDRCTPGSFVFNGGTHPYCLASRDAKMNFIGAFLREHLDRKKLPDYVWEFYRNDWLGGREVPENASTGCEWSIPLPVEQATGFAHKQFFMELKDYLLREDIVMYGLDNNVPYELPCGVSPMERDIWEAVSSQPHEESFLEKTLGVMGYVIARKDPIYGHWVLLDRFGVKARFRFDDEKVTCSSLPELVDIKITDKCNYNCPFCYQNSYSEGSHAYAGNVYTLLKVMSELQVLECVFGGGDPVEHPDFTRFLERCREYNIHPSFTTRNLEWFGDKYNRKVFEDCNCAVAISVSSVAAAKAVEQLKNVLRYPFDMNVSIQCVDSVDPVIDILRNTQRRTKMTILGYKPVGRGQDYLGKKAGSGSEVLRLIRDRCFDHDSIGVDTKFIMNYRDELMQLPDYELFCDEREGGHGMYIDAVNLTMAESSWSGVPEPLGKNSARWRDSIHEFFNRM